MAGVASYSEGTGSEPNCNAPNCRLSPWMSEEPGISTAIAGILEVMEVLFFCCLSLCCCRGRGLEPWASVEPGDTCWPSEGTGAILGRAVEEGGAMWGEGAVCWGGAEEEGEGGWSLFCRKASIMEEVDVVGW